MKMDVHSPKKRSYNMSRIKGKDTKPEKILRLWLWHHGYRYRLHRKDLPGKPDIVFSKIHKVIFVHGCFWHKHNCKYFKWPSTNADFWKKKITANIHRDKKTISKLKAAGWDCLVVWECSLKEKCLDKLWDTIRRFLSGGQDEV